MADGRHLGKIEKWPYLSNGSIDRREIWHGGAFWPSWAFPSIKFSHFGNPRWLRPPSWKIEKLPYLSNGLTDRREIWHGDAFWPSWPFPLLKLQSFENPRWRYVIDLKLANDSFKCDSACVPWLEFSIYFNFCRFEALAYITLDKMWIVFLNL